MKTLLSAVAVLFTVGCARPQFVRTDTGAALAPSATRPIVHLDELPAQAYKVVGIVEVRANITPEPLEMLLEEAAEEGQARGCDVLVARELHRVAQGLPYESRPPPQQMMTMWGVMATMPAAPRQFVCGVYSHT